MARQYTQKQFEELFDKLPEELQDTIFSMETSDAIAAASENNNITDKRVAKIAKYTGRVLMGILLTSEFEQVLQKEVGLSKNKAKIIAREINRFVFYPVKPALDQLHDIETKPAMPKITAQKPASEEKPTLPPQKEDLYREIIEEENE